MNSRAPLDGSCTVQRPALLPSDVGGADGVCSEIRAAVRAAGTGPVNVTVTVVSVNQLVASVTNRNGRKLPNLRFARFDKPLNRASVARFARTIAAAAGE